MEKKKIVGQVAPQIEVTQTFKSGKTFTSKGLVKAVGQTADGKKWLSILTAKAHGVKTPMGGLVKEFYWIERVISYDTLDPKGKELVDGLLDTYKE